MYKRIDYDRRNFGKRGPSLTGEFIDSGSVALKSPESRHCEAPRSATMAEVWKFLSRVISLEILEGFGSEFDSFVSSVTTCVDPFSLEDLYGHPLAHEIRLEQQQPTIDLSLASANFANRGNSARGGRDGRHSTTSHSPRAEFPLLAKLAPVRERSSVGYCCSRRISWANRCPYKSLRERGSIQVMTVLTKESNLEPRPTKRESRRPT
uniref:Uncharacterized protein n=1 Tax=Quercus lobata TaxID=97700 RepID=A0A7N2M6I2_QUELO